MGGIRRCVSILRIADFNTRLRIILRYTDVLIGYSLRELWCAPARQTDRQTDGHRFLPKCPGVYGRYFDEADFDPIK